MGVVSLIRGRWVHWRDPWGFLGSVTVVGLTRTCPRGRLVHPWSLGSFACTLSVVDFISGRMVNSRAPWVSLGRWVHRREPSGCWNIRCRWVYSRTLCGS